MQMLRPPYSKAYITELRLEIRDKFLEYYTSLYTSRVGRDPIAQEAFLSELELVYLEKNVQEFLLEPFSEEIISAIKALRGSTAPGLDGFTGEFYKSYKDLLAPTLLEVYAEDLERKSLPPTLFERLSFFCPNLARTRHCVGLTDLCPY